MWFSKEDFLYEMFSGKIRKKGFPDRTFERKILFKKENFSKQKKNEV